MVLLKKNPPSTFRVEYNKLSEKDQWRVRRTIITHCGISERQFYRWLDDYSLISKVHKEYIANVVFDVPIPELFKDDFNTQSA